MTSSNPAPRPFRLGTLALLLALSFIMTLPAMQGDLLGYDDVNLIQGRDGAASMSPVDFFTGTYYYAYLPFYGLSYWTDIALAGGVNTTWLHFVNVLWHAAAGFALFVLLLRLLDNRVAALFGAVLFVLHPMHVESVAWIAGRKELMSAFFLFVAWLLALRAEEGSRLAMIGGVACFLVACFSKASAVVLPALLLAAAWLLPRYAGRRKTAAVATWPFWLAALLPVAVHLLVAVDRGVIRDVADLGQRSMWWTTGWGGSILRALVPYELSIEYPGVRTATATQAAIGAAILAAAGVAVFVFRKRAPYAAFGIAAFLIALAPFNNIFPATDVLAADRYLYLSLFGLTFAFGWLASRGPTLAVGATVLAMAYLGLSLHGAIRFQSDEVLWTRTIESQPEAAIAYLNRGIDRTTRAQLAVPLDGELLRAGVDDLRAGVGKAHRDEIRAKGALAMALPLLRLSEKGEALRRVDQALELVTDTERPESRQFRAQALYQRGVLRMTMGSFDIAAQDFAFAAELVPSFDSHFEAGRCFSRAKDPKNAREQLRKAAEMNRDSADPWLELAMLEARTRNRTAERDALEAAARREPASPAVASGWVEYWLSGETPDWRKAKEELQRIDSRSPRRKELAAWVDARRALVLFRRGDVKDAVQAADDARNAGLSKSKMLYELGEVYLSAGRYDEAASCFLSASGVLDERTAWRDAAARAYALKSYALVVAEDTRGALRAFDAALKVRPRQIEAGMAPLRGEIELLAESDNVDIRLLAIAAVAGDPAVGRRASDALFAGELSEKDLVLGLRMRALLRVFVTNDFEGAEADLAEVLAKRPGDRWARYRLAQASLRNGVGWIRTADAIRSSTRREQGVGSIKAAIALLSELVSEHPDFVYARLLRGEAWFSLDDEVGAKADYQQVRALAPNLKEVYLREAVLHRLVYVKGGTTDNLHAGIRILGQALQLDPNYFDALFEVGNMYHLLYDRPEAGNASRRTSFSQAILAYRRAMAVNPRAREPRQEWARICLKAGRDAVKIGELRAAHEMLLQVAKDASDIAELHKDRVRLNLHADFARSAGMSMQDAYQQAFAALEELGRLAPDDPELPSLRSLYQRRLGGNYMISWIRQTDPARKARAKQMAIEALRRAVELAPDDPENAAVRVRLRQLAPELIELDRKRAEKVYGEAVKHFDAGRYDEAIPGFREAHLLFPEAVELEYMYGLTLARAKKFDIAQEVLEKVANSKESSEFPRAAFVLGKICLVKKSPVAARAWFERYLKVMQEQDRLDDPGVAAAREALRDLAEEK